MSVDYPIRKLRVLFDVILKELDPVFAAHNAAEDRPSIPTRALAARCVIEGGA